MKDEGWITMRFDEFAERVNETVMPVDSDLKRYIGPEHIDKLDLIIRRWDEGRNLVGKKLIVRKGDIIIGKRRWYLRRVGIAPFDALCSAHTIIVRPKLDVIDPQFLPFFLLGDQFYQKGLSISVGSLSPTINWGTLRETKFKIPAKSKQKQIANILTHHLDVRESDNRITSASLRALQIARNKFLYKPMFDNSDVETCTIEEICNILNSQRIPINSNHRKEMTGDIPYYGATGIVGYIDKHIFDGDLILLAEDGGPFWDYFEKPIAYRVNGKSWVNNHAHVLQAKDPEMYDWIYHCLVHRNIIPHISGTTRGKLTAKELRRIRIPIYSHEERKRILGIITSLESVYLCSKNRENASFNLQKSLIDELEEIRI
jgi:restriction endonuclease S subunit